MTFNDAWLDPSFPGLLISADPIFIKLQTMKIEDIFKYQISKFIFKCLRGITTGNFQNWFVINQGRYNYNTRSTISISEGVNTNNLFIPFTRTTNYGLKQMKTYGPRIWNKLPSDLKTLTSLPVFLKKLKTHYISSYSYDHSE